MRILHILDHSLPLHSGYSFRTASILREQRKLGWETFHLTSPKHVNCSALEEEVEGLHFFRTPPPKELVPRLPVASLWRIMHATEIRLTELARKLQPDLLHAHSPILNAYPALRVGKRLGIPVVYEIRAFWEDAAVDHGTQHEWGIRYRITRTLETRAVRRANQVVTICDGLKTELEGRGIPAEKIHIVPNAVDINEFPMETRPVTAMRARLGLADCRVIGFIGSYYAYEGLDLLIRSLPYILERLPEARLLLVGGGPQESHLKTLAASLGLLKKVHFVGRVPHREVIDYYNLIDLLAYPRYPMRLTNLVTPLKPLEAMAQGRLLIASAVGGHKELIEDRRTGILFQPENIEDLAEKALLALDLPIGGKEIRLRARAYVEAERTWSKSVARYEQIYAKALEQYL